jgi:hypothetical protein
MRAREFIIEEDEYRGEHGAPDSTSGAPLHNVSLNGIYPDDFYSSVGPRYYNDGGNDFQTCYSIVANYHNRPNKPVKIYRAVPKKPSIDDLIDKYTEQKAYILKHGKLPKDADVPNLSYSAYYEFIDDKIKHLSEMPPSPPPDKIRLNVGDWVTISRKYAVEHGRDNLNNQYRIVSKTVSARDIFTAGDSLHEWGYDPQPVVPRDNKPVSENDARLAVKNDEKPHISGGSESSENLYLYIEPVNSDRIRERIGKEKVIDQRGNIVITKGTTFRSQHGNIIGGRYLIVNDTNDIVAGLNYTKMGKSVIISNIYVRPDYRRKALGSRLVDAIKLDYPRVRVDSNMTELGGKFFGYEK